MTPLTQTQRRELRARGQKLKAHLRLGNAGFTDAWLKSLDAALAANELVKVRLSDDRDERETLVPQIAERSGSELVTTVGHVALFYRERTKAVEGAASSAP